MSDDDPLPKRVSGKSKKFFKRTIVLLMCFVIVVVYFPIILLTCIVLGLVRQGIFVLAKLFKSEVLVSPLSLYSSIIANLDHIYNNRYAFSLICPLIVEGEGVTVEQVREIVKKRYNEKQDPDTGEPLYKELLYGIKYWLGYPFWKKLKGDGDTFLEQCIYLYDPTEDAPPVTYEKLQEVLKELSFKPFQEDKPLVDIICIPRFIPDPQKQPFLKADGKYMVTILRMHHALADGFSLLNLAKNLSLNTPAENFQHRIVTDYMQKASTRGKHQSVFQRCVKGVSLGTKMVYETAEYIYNSTKYTSEGKLWPANFKDKPWEEDKVMDNFKVMFSRTFTLEDMKQIKILHKVSVTAVMYSAILGALRKTLFQDAIKVPRKIGLGLSLPIPRTTERLMNNAATTVLFLPFDETDPVKRLQTMHKKLLNLKHSTLHIASTLLTVYVGGLIPGFLFRLLDNLDRKKREMVVISNMPGAPKTVDIGGFLAKGGYWITGFNARRNYVLFTLISYMGNVQLCMLGGSHLLDSSDKLEAFESAFFQELEVLKENGDTGHLEEKKYSFSE